jgi:hypothetical protein
MPPFLSTAADGIFAAQTSDKRRGSILKSVRFQKGLP